jgi:hypothetical protein
MKKTAIILCAIALYCAVMAALVVRGLSHEEPMEAKMVEYYFPERLVNKKVYYYMDGYKILIKLRATPIEMRSIMNFTDPPSSLFGTSDLLNPGNSDERPIWWSPPGRKNSEQFLVRTDRMIDNAMIYYFAECKDGFTWIQVTSF